MTNEIIFYTQIASIITFVVSLFVVYRVLVDQKDATIQLLKEKISILSEQLTEARSSTPDLLAQSLSARVNLLQAELGRLQEDNSSTQEQIKHKENELNIARQNAEKLTRQVSHAQELLQDFLCPHCGSALAQREYCSESFEYNGRDVDIDHEFSLYECGYSVIDGSPSDPCTKKAGHGV